MSDGQKLRWWQEDAASQTAHIAAERLAPAPTPLLQETTVPLPVVEPATLAETETEQGSNTWAELESEAVRRAAGAKTEEAECFPFYLDKSTAYARYRREIRNWVLAFIFLQALSFIVSATITPLLSGGLGYKRPFDNLFGQVIVWVPIGILYFYLRLVWIRNTNRPVVCLTSQGVSLRLVPRFCFHRSSVFVPWKDITSIRPKKLFASHYLEIYSKKMGRLYVYQKDLPISPEEMAEQIEDYEAARGIS